MLSQSNPWCCVCTLSCLLWCVGFGPRCAESAGTDPSDSPDPMTLLDRYEKTLLPYKRIKGKWTVEVHEWESGKEPRWLGSTQECTVLRDADRAKVSSIEIGGKGKSASHFEDVSKQGETWLSIYSDGSVFSKLEVPAEDFPVRLGMAPSAPCYGIIRQKLIPAFLRASKLSAKTATLEGTAVCVLKGISEDDEISLWLDPSLDYAPRRIHYKRSSQMIRESWQFDVKRFQQQGDLPVVSEATVTFTAGPQPVMSPVAVEKVVDGKTVLEHEPAKDASGKVVMTPKSRFVREIKLVSLDFNPEFGDDDFKILQPIANGTRVHMQDASHLDYMWVDGEILVATDPKALAAARGALLYTGVGVRLFWALLFPAAVLLVVVGWVFYRRRKSSAKI